MKRVFLMFAMAFITIMSFGQKIDLDRITPDGIRVISTNTKRFTSAGDGALYLSLDSYILSGGQEFYYINLSRLSSTNFSIPKDGLLLIKTGFEEIIECKQTLEDYLTEDIIGTYSSVTKTIDHTITGSYEIKLDDLKKIASSGIIKVRFDTSAGYKEVNYQAPSKIKTKKYFEEALENISKAKEKSGNIRDGF